MEYKVEKKENNTYEVDVKVDKSEVKKHFDAALAHEAENAEIQGFRKGKAPISVVKENVDPSKLSNHALNHILPDVYSQIVKESKLTPIIQPRFEIKVFEEDKDLELSVVIVEKPDIKLGDYRKELKNKGKEKAKSAKTEEEKELTNEEIVATLIDISEIGISDMLVDEETNRMMSSLIDQTARMGLTVDQYLEAQGKTADALREEYKGNAKNNIKGDFLITEIAQTDGISVSDEEVEMTISMIPDEASKAELAKPEQRMYIKAVLLKNKTLEELKGMAKGEETKKEENNSEDKTTSDKKEDKKSESKPKDSNKTSKDKSK